MIRIKSLRTWFRARMPLSENKASSMKNVSSSRPLSLIERKRRWRSWILTSYLHQPLPWKLNTAWIQVMCNVIAQIIISKQLFPSLSFSLLKQTGLPATLSNIGNGPMNCLTNLKWATITWLGGLEGYLLYCFCGILSAMKKACMVPDWETHRHDLKPTCSHLDNPKSLKEKK